MNEEKATDEISDELAEENDITEDQEQNIIYETEKSPVLRMAIWFFGTIISIAVVLFVVGFIMGWNGIRPPSIDSNVIQNQWDKVTSQTESPQSSSELDKVKQGE